MSRQRSISAPATPISSFRHLMPNALAPVLICGMLAIGDAIILEATLGFFGLGAQPPTPSWGAMMSSGSRADLQRALDHHLSRPDDRDHGRRHQSVRRCADHGARYPRQICGRREAHGAARRRRSAPSASAIPGRSTAFGFASTRAKILGVVGESGSGKVADRALGHGPAAADRRPRRRVARSVFDGRDLTGLPERELRRLRGRRIALITQNPMTSLDPVDPGRRTRSTRCRGCISGSTPAPRRHAAST